MNKLNILAVVVGVFLVALMIGRYWNLKPETKQSHVVHSGETAVAEGKGKAAVFVASTPELAYDLMAAATRGEQAVIDKAIEEKTAFAIESGAQVKITGESESKRSIVVTSGPQTGKTGWVEFESLRLLKPGEI